MGHFQVSEVSAPMKLRLAGIVLIFITGSEAQRDAREWVQGNSGCGAKDTEAHQEANRWGRGGGDPNRYRPAGLPDKY
ncbi:hypothetical protein CHARACLAT_014274 [Characodon lateralis]|uniref:Uncharacterized protein n=1 Tax=Characodon lateralis TaxID=208331 RepID=A0ABU7ELQ0_9TELE|nr:hypothetical protein [Characodon lateralis]